MGLLNEGMDNSEIAARIEELTEQIQILAERENAHYTEMMLMLKELEPVVDTGRSFDDLYEEALDLVNEAGKASISFLQEELGVKYRVAANLIDMLEKRGIIGPADGAKPREVIDQGSE